MLDVAQVDLTTEETLSHAVSVLASVQLVFAAVVHIDSSDITNFDSSKVLKGLAVEGSIDLSFPLLVLLSQSLDSAVYNVVNIGSRDAVVACEIEHTL